MVPRPAAARAGPGLATRTTGEGTAPATDSPDSTNPHGGAKPTAASLPQMIRCWSKDSLAKWRSVDLASGISGRQIDPATYVVIPVITYPVICSIDNRKRLIAGSPVLKRIATR